MIIAICHNIRSLHNIGSFFRTADAAGIDKIYLTGYTAIPPRPEISKTALGAENFVEWEKYTHIGKLLRKLKSEGFFIVAVEKTKNSIPYKEFHSKKPIAFIVGNEVKGISKKVLDLADKIIEIPMRGQKESLNVSVAFGVAAYYLESQNPKGKSQK